jgi:hypothetical protein
VKIVNHHVLQDIMELIVNYNAVVKMVQLVIKFLANVIAAKLNFMKIYANQNVVQIHGVKTVINPVIVLGLARVNSIQAHVYAEMEE